MSLREETRRCACGTPLSQSNKTRECSVCETLRCDAEILDNRRARQVLAARKAMGVYAHPEHHRSNEEYLVALTASLDSLCDALSITRPVFVEEGP